MVNIDSFKKVLTIKHVSGSENIELKAQGTSDKIEDSIIYWLREWVLCQILHSVRLQTFRHVSS